MKMDAIISNNLAIKSGVYIWNHIFLEDNVFVRSSVTFTNDRDPRSTVYPDRYPITKVYLGASIGGIPPFFLE